MLIVAIALLTASVDPAPNRSDLDLSLQEIVRSDLRQVRQDIRETTGRDPDIRYARAYVDLNGDGRDEALVYVMGPYVCGTGGCDLTIYRRRGRGWQDMGSLSIVHLPVRVLNSRHHGWRDLSVFVAGGGIQPGYQARIPFDGRAYASNPSVPPAQPLRNPGAGQTLIPPGEPGQPLF